VLLELRELLVFKVNKVRLVLVFRVLLDYQGLLELRALPVFRVFKETLELRV
jgi:hypothetical protein